jgi:hypothetical protein
MISDPWFLACVLSTLAGTSLALLLVAHAAARPDLLRRHTFFIFFFVVVTAYLQLAPLASLLAPLPEVLIVYRIPSPRHYLREYAIVQALCLVFFQLPLFLAYVWPDRRPAPERTLVVRQRRGLLLAVTSLALAAGVLAVIARNNLWYLRVGADVLVQRIVALPFADYLIFRSYQETALLLIGVLFFAARRAEGRTRRWLTAAFAVNAALTGTYNLLVSRWFVVMLSVCLGGWWLATRRRLYWTPRALGLLIGGGLLTCYLMVLVVNVRNAGWQNAIDAGVLNPFGSGIFADSQGVARLNCVDMMARMLPGIQEKGPTFGASWGQVIWLGRRFVDPEGFDRYRLSMATTAKSHLMQEYLNWQLPDYFSCTATDLFGTFHVAGLLVGALALAGLFRFAGRALVTPRSGTHVILGIFVLTQILIFDQEAATAFFGWPRRLPMLALLLLLNPFTTVAPPRVDAAPSVPRP